jgi:molybdopterin-guanine dinucleotide biosynthesis protein A
MDFRVTGCILAGGEATRMGRVNKGAQTLHGRALFDIVSSNLAPQVDKIIVSANEYAEYYRQKGYPVIEDLRQGFLGPLSGIESVLLSDSSLEWLFCCPVDTPFVPSRLVPELVAAARKTGAKAVTPVWGEFREHLHSLVHASLLPSLTEFLDGGERSVGFWLRRCDAVYMPFDADEFTFANINTLEELNSFSGEPPHVRS